ncbi:MAG TPA: nucleotidyltransferase family protein [Bacteroidales bacterium]|nr:nucleotidyltransferase family protein [Bacteroidales bacterium]
MINPVDSFILNAARLELKDVHVEALKALVTEISDWNEFENKTRIHGVQALIYNSLKKNHLSGLIPQPVYENLRASYYRNAYRNTLIGEEINRIKEIVSDQIVLLKGAALINSFYKNIALRELCDLDILIEKGKAWMIWNEMRNNGYRLIDDTQVFKSSLHEKLYSNYYDSHLLALCSVNIAVEVHWNIMRSPEHYTITSKAFENTVCIDEDRDLHVLSDEFQLIHLCCHFAKHMNSPQEIFVPLKWLCDINEFLETKSETLNWQLIEEICNEIDVFNEMRDSLSYVHVLMGVPIPEYFRNMIIIERNNLDLGSLQKKMTFKYQHERGNIYKESSQKFSFLNNGKEKFTFFFRSMFPVKKWIIHKYGSNVALGYSMYWSDMFARYILKKK